MILALDGAGGAERFASYEQWEAARSAGTGPPPPAEARGAATSRERSRPPVQAKRLGYLDQREWDGMEQAILAAEAVVAEAQRAVEDPAVASDAMALQARYAALDAAHAEVARLYARWAEAKLVP